MEAARQKKGYFIHPGEMIRVVALRWRSMPNGEHGLEVLLLRLADGLGGGREKN